MHWLFIGALLGSTVMSFHDTREACEGRKTLLAEKSVTAGKCVELPREATGLTLSTPNWTTR